MKRKIIRNYAIFVALEGLAISFFFASYQLFLIGKGLSLLEINLLNCGYMVANFLFEIPTGAIADSFGRKRSVIIGLWLFAFSFLVYFIADTFWQFLVAEIIGALAATCVSGAIEALVFDSLSDHGERDASPELFRKAEIRTIGVIVGVIIGSYFAGYNLAWPWLLSAIAFSFLALVSKLLLPNDAQARKIVLKDLSFRFNFSPLKTVARESINYGWKNNRLMIMIYFSAIYSFAMMPINMYWPIVLKNNFSVSIQAMGIVFAGIAISFYVGAQLSKLWQKRIKCEKNAIFLSQIITLLGLLGCLFFVKLSPFLVFFLLHEAGRGLLNPLYRDYINKSIESRNRATVLSFESMITKAAAALGLILSGIVADYFGILSSWSLSAFVLFISIIWFYGKNK